MLLVRCVLVFAIFNVATCNRKGMEGFIVGGKNTAIESFPHSAYMSLACVKQNILEKSRCGAAIVNQWILLTAAHCFDSCQKQTKISFHVGDEYFGRGETVAGSKYVTHPEYSSMRNINDVALVKVKTPLKFTAKIGRVLLKKDAPYKEIAFVAGWGFIDEVKRISSNHLQYAPQKIINPGECSKLIGPQNMNPGCFCGGAIYAKGYVAPGDSGSALVVRRSIHIGIVSYKVPLKSASIAVYTNTSYHYDWIVETAKKLQCEGD